MLQQQQQLHSTSSPFPIFFVLFCFVLFYSVSSLLFSPTITTYKKHPLLEFVSFLTILKENQMPVITWDVITTWKIQPTLISLLLSILLCRNFQDIFFFFFTHHTKENITTTQATAGCYQSVSLIFHIHHHHTTCPSSKKKKKTRPHHQCNAFIHSYCSTFYPLSSPLM